MALVGLQRLQHFGSRQVGVAAFRFQYGVGVRVRFDDGANVLGELGILLFPAWSGSGGKVLQAAETLLELV